MPRNCRSSGLQPEQPPARPRFHRFAEENYPYFATAAVRNRRPAFASLQAAELFRSVLYQARDRYGFLLLAFAIMPDHFHAVVVPRFGDTISQVMRFIKGTFARRYNALGTTTGPFWQERLYDHIVRDEDGLRDIIRYVEWNAVAAGLCATPTSYRYSSACHRNSTDLEFYLRGEPEAGQGEALAYEGSKSGRAVRDGEP